MSNVPFGVYIAVLLGLATLSGVGAVVSVAIEEWRYMSTANQLARWRKLYKKEFGIELGDVVIPKRMRGFGRLIIVVVGITFWQVLAALGKRFATCLYYDINNEVFTDERTNAIETYAFWVYDGVEADEWLKNLSANDIKAQRLATETLTERLLHELVYYDETGKHLDPENITLCAGSRDSDGFVPGVNWDTDYHRQHVGWYDPGSSSDRLRARQVIAA